MGCVYKKYVEIIQQKFIYTNCFIRFKFLFIIKLRRKHSRTTDPEPWWRPNTWFIVKCQGCAALVLHECGDVDEVADGLSVKAGGEQVGVLAFLAPGRRQDRLPVTLRKDNDSTR